MTHNYFSNKDCGLNKFYVYKISLSARGRREKNGDHVRGMWWTFRSCCQRRRFSHSDRWASLRQQCFSQVLRNFFPISPYWWPLYIVGPIPLFQENLKIKSDCLRLLCFIPSHVWYARSPDCCLSLLYEFLFNNYIICYLSIDPWYVQCKSYIIRFGFCFLISLFKCLISS